MAITVCLMFRISFKAGWWYHLQKMSGIPQVGRDGTNAWNQSNPICNREYHSNKWYICIFDYWFMEYSIYYHILVTSIIYWFMVNGELWILLFRIIQSNCIYIIIYTYIYIYKQPTISLLVVRTVNKNMFWLWTSYFSCGSNTIYFLIANPMCCA